MKYIIISLKHSTKDTPCFWRANNAGYTNFPFVAGQYTDEEVKAEPAYYDNGIDALAIPLTEAGLDSIGFKCSVDVKKVIELANKIEKKRGR